MRVTVNAIGETCPIPVVMTRNAIKELEGSGIVEVLVDNEIAKQNLLKMATQKGYQASAEDAENGTFRVIFTIGEEKGDLTINEAEYVCEIPAPKKKNTVVVICSDQMGTGDETLGKNLLKAYIYAVTQLDELPRTMLFYNAGARMTVEDSPALEDLKNLAEAGVVIKTCGTCLNYYGLSEKLAVGEVTNMYDIVETMSAADLIMKP